MFVSQNSILFIIGKSCSAVQHRDVRRAYYRRRRRKKQKVSAAAAEAAKIVGGGGVGGVEPFYQHQYISKFVWPLKGPLFLN